MPVCRPFRILALSLIPLVLELSACATARSNTPSLDSGAAAQAARNAEAAIRDGLYAAVARYDYAAIRRGLTPTFELEEDSLRLSGEQFIGLVRGFEGKATISYRLDGFVTRVADDGGRVAWTSYRNHGTFTPAGGQPLPLEWLETAVLVRDESGVWRIDRLHATSIRASR